MVHSAKCNRTTTTFGTSGLFYRINKAMYYRATNSLWRQFTGEPAIGSLADSGIKLLLFPVLLTTRKEGLAEHPDTQVYTRSGE